ncbi:MAG: hypothetical protein D3914_09740 [Candidatus Electrothrix sp. LOE2]|jgi:hypothetical protein|nr:hypothetical protein [Candidatus Electrothrix sp. LOE2]
MCNQKLKNSGYQGGVMLQAVSVMMFLLSVTVVPSAVGKELTGIVKETPGIAWPVGTWMVEDNEIRVTEQTVIKGDQSQAHFGAKVTVKGSRVNGVFIASEFEIRQDDDPTFAGR